MAELTINSENWQYASEINKVVEAINERRKAVFLNPIDYVVRGTNIQTAEFWNHITSSISSNDGWEIGRFAGGAFQGTGGWPSYYDISIGDNLQKWIKEKLPFLVSFMENTNCIYNASEALVIEHLSGDSFSGSFATAGIAGNCLVSGMSRGQLSVNGNLVLGAKNPSTNIYFYDDVKTGYIITNTRFMVEQSLSGSSFVSAGFYLFPNYKYYSYY